MTDEAPFSDTEKRTAKALKKLAQDEGWSWKHHHCLRLVRSYADERAGRGREEFAAFIFERETANEEMVEPP